MMIAMMIILSLILVFEIAIFIVISAKELGCDERERERTADRLKDNRKPDDGAAQRLIDEKKKREIEDYMRDIEALNKFGNEYENKK